MKIKSTLAAVVLLSACVTGKPIPEKTPMVKVNGGTFLSGYDRPCEKDFTCDDLVGTNSDKELKPIFPTMLVTVPTFYIDEHEVTNEQYEYCVQMGVCPGRNADTFKGMGGIDYNHDPGYANYPAIGLTYHDAQIYCRFAGKRLPTEFEWELTAMGGHAVQKEDEKAKYLYPNRVKDFENAVGKSCGGVQISGCPESDMAMPAPVMSSENDVVYIDGDHGKAVYDLTGNVAEFVEGIPLEPTTDVDADKVQYISCSDDLPQECKYKYGQCKDKGAENCTCNGECTDDNGDPCVCRHVNETWYFGSFCDKNCTDSYAVPTGCSDADVFFMCKHQDKDKTFDGIPICRKYDKPVKQDELFDKFRDYNVMREKVVIKGCSYDKSCGGYSGPAAVCGARVSNRFIQPIDNKSRLLGFRCAADLPPK